MKKKYHELKTWKVFFEAIASGVKKFEVRKNDRDFQVGDRLELNEFDHVERKFTGRFAWKEISYILPGGAFGIDDGFVVLSLKDI